MTVGVGVWMRKEQVRIEKNWVVYRQPRSLKTLVDRMGYKVDYIENTIKETLQTRTTCHKACSNLSLPFTPNPLLFPILDLFTTPLVHIPLFPILLPPQILLLPLKLIFPLPLRLST